MQKKIKVLGVCVCICLCVSALWCVHIVHVYVCVLIGMGLHMHINFYSTAYFLLFIPFHRRIRQKDVPLVSKFGYSLRYFTKLSWQVDMDTPHIIKVRCYS